MTEQSTLTTTTAKLARHYLIQIDDLPEEVFAASSDLSLFTTLREMLKGEVLSHIGHDVHMTITRPDGSCVTCTVDEMRKGACLG